MTVYIQALCSGSIYDRHSLLHFTTYLPTYLPYLAVPGPGIVRLQLSFPRKAIRYSVGRSRSRHVLQQAMPNDDSIAALDRHVANLAPWSQATFTLIPWFLTSFL